MKKILGLDLGVASIGWAFILENENDPENNTIIGTGVRVIPLDTASEKDEFTKGGNVGTNVKRRSARGARRNLHRFKLRRQFLSNVIHELGLSPSPELYQLSPAQLYHLREKALTDPLTPGELGRVLLHLNVRRGFKSNRKGEEKSESEYKEAIKSRELKLQERHQTIGQFFATEFKRQPDFRVRQEIFNRSSYIAEFDLIWNRQSSFYPDLLTEENRRKVRDKIIYYQRPLKSQKGLVGECALEWNYAIDKITRAPKLLRNGQPKIVRPKCAPKTSPLAQVVRIWENIHNISITDETGKGYPLSQEQKQAIFDLLQEKKEMSASELLKFLKLSPTKYTTDELIRTKKLKGNSTRFRLLEVFQKVGIPRRDVLSFQPKIETVKWVDENTAEEIQRLQVVANFDEEPLYQLWHLIYATEEEQDLVQLLMKRYEFSREQAEALAAIDFTSEGYTNKSSRAMRKILPYLQTGNHYADACKKAGYNHSNSLTLAEIEARKLLDQLELLPKNSLRNPVVEKILNQMIHVVNAILEHPKMGRPDEIRVELARELKQSAKERQKVFSKQNQRERDRKMIRSKIAEILKIQPQSVTKVQIEKWQLWHEVDGFSLYTGKKTELSAFLKGEGVDVEHIIPRSRCFDDSFENKTICETRFNQDKDKQTARDFIESQAVQGLQDIDAYLRRINDLAKTGRSGGVNGEGISRAKYERLMMRAADIPNDFVNRQLRETQYITKKAREILMDVCRRVYGTSGSVTDFLRHQWGWDEVIEQDRLPQFRAAGKTVQVKIKKGTQTKEVIADWSKRSDHRHHALDALTVACTKQSYIQQLNNLNQTFEQLLGEQRRDALRSHGAKMIANKNKAPFTTAAVLDAMKTILVSYKQGNKVATRSKNKANGQITLTPRGPLHEETIYGRIKRYKTVEVNTRFDPNWLKEMAHPHQKEALEQRLQAFGNDPKKAFKNLAKDPILWNGRRIEQVTIWEYTYVSRKSIDTNLTDKQAAKIVDLKVRAAVLERLNEGEGKPKEAFKNLAGQPILAGGPYPVKKARVLNPAEKMIRLPRGYAEPGGNHHIAIYKDEKGDLKERVVTFRDAFLRLMCGLPPIIKDVKAAYFQIENTPSEKIPNDLLLPDFDWEFVVSLEINDYFLFDVDASATDVFDPVNKSALSPKLFRVRKLSLGAYWFMHHLETEALEDVDSKAMGRCKQASKTAMVGAIKVKLDRLGYLLPA